MRASFHQKVVAASTFLIFCSVGAGVLGAMSAPAASIRGAQTGITDVNRVNKADPLTASPARQVRQRLSQAAETAQTSRPPLGCDPAFSPVADPARAGIYKRCAV
jgi:hypothetical protein